MNQQADSMMPSKRGPGRPSNAERQRTASAQASIPNSTPAVVTRMDQQYRRDGWANLIVGLGGRQDKRKHTYQAAGSFLVDIELENLYFHEGLATRIVDVVADDMTRQWIDLGTQEENEEPIHKNRAALQAFLIDVSAQSIFNEALKWKRLYAGAVVYMAALDGGDLATPLNPARIREFGKMKVIDRSDIDITLSHFQTDPNQPDFGEPIDFWCWIQTGVVRQPFRIHASRVIQFRGKKVPRGASNTLTLEQRFWGMSILQALHEALKDYGGINSAVANIMYDVVVGKYKLNGLADQLANGNEKGVMDRMMLMDMSKSILRAVMLDTESGEDYTRDSVSLAGIADILDRVENRVCGVTGIPQTRLFGKAPGGLSTDDKSGISIYYDMVGSEQETDLKPAVQQLVDVWRAWQKIKEEMPVKFNSLVRLTDKEKADLAKVEADSDYAKAQSYNLYLTGGVLDPEEVREMAWGDELEEIGFGRALPDNLVPPTPEEQAQQQAQAAAAIAAAKNVGGGPPSSVPAAAQKIGSKSETPTTNGGPQ